MTRSRFVPALLLAPLLLLAAVSASALALVNERAVSPAVRRPSAGFEAPLLPLATNGSTFFTAWIETHAGGNAVVGTRIAADGRVLDPAGLQLAPTEAEYGKTAVLWTGRDYVVFAPESAGIVVTHVRGGQTVVPFRDHIADAGIFMIDTAAWNGSHYALVVRGKTLAGAVVAKLIILEPDFSVARQTALNGDFSGTAATTLLNDGSGFLLVWENYTATSDTVFVQRLGADGAPAGAARTVPVAGHNTRRLGSYWPAAAPNGNGGFTIVWMDTRIHGITMAADGTFGAPFAISEEDGLFPSIAWNGREHLVTWTHTAAAADGYFQLNGARIAADGSIRQAGTLATTNRGEVQATLAGIPTGFLGVWLGNVIGDAEHDSLASRYFAQNGPLLAAGNSTLLVAWGEGGGIYATRLTPDGTPLDGDGIRLGLPQSTELVAPLAVASTGKVYLVAWSRANGQVALSRITEEGVLLDPGGGVLLDAPATSLDAASDGTDFLLVWSNGGALTSLRVPAEGAIPEAPHPQPVSRFAEEPLALIWNGSTYSLLWQQALEGDPVQQQRLSPLAPDGRILGTAIIGVNLAVGGIERAGDELLVVYSLASLTYTQRFTRAGDPAAERVPVLVRTVPPILTPTRDGFALLYENGDAMLLDERGNPRSMPATVPRMPDVQVHDAVFAHGITRVAYTAPRAAPETTEALARAFTGELRIDATPPGGRRRATGR